jgi:hypothetical protein
VGDKYAKDKVLVAFGCGVLVEMLFLGIAVQVGGNGRYVGVISDEVVSSDFSMIAFPEQDATKHRLKSNKIGIAFPFPHLKRTAKIFIPHYRMIQTTEQYFLGSSQ